MAERTETLEDGSRLCKMTLASDGFAADWRHCDLLSNYVSHVVSFDKPDPFVFSNLLSTVINEIFESIYRNHCSGLIDISLYKAGNDTVIVSEIPVNVESRAFYLDIPRCIDSSAAGSRYREEIMKTTSSISPAIGFFELAADYGAKICVDDLPQSGRIKLSVRVCLEKLVEEDHT